MDRWTDERVDAYTWARTPASGPLGGSRRPAPPSSFAGWLPEQVGRGRRRNTPGPAPRRLLGSVVRACARRVAEAGVSGRKLAPCSGTARSRAAPARPALVLPRSRAPGPLPPVLTSAAAAARVAAQPARRWAGNGRPGPRRKLGTEAESWDGAPGKAIRDTAASRGLGRTDGCHLVRGVRPPVSGESPGPVSLGFGLCLARGPGTGFGAESPGPRTTPTPSPPPPSTRVLGAFLRL